MIPDHDADNGKQVLLTQDVLHGHTQRPVSQVILDLIRLMIKINPYATRSHLGETVGDLRKCKN